MDSTYIYIITNSRNTVLYTGSTSSIKNRINHHKKRLIPGFSKKYNLEKLVYYKKCKNRVDALEREKQIKNGSRKNKILLVEKTNPQWHDLYHLLP